MRTNNPTSKLHFNNKLFNFGVIESYIILDKMYFYFLLLQQLRIVFSSRFRNFCKLNLTQEIKMSQWSYEGKTGNNLAFFEHFILEEIAFLTKDFYFL